MSDLKLGVQVMGKLWEASNNVKRKIKGTRPSYVFPILVIGMAGDITLKEAVLATGLKADNLHHRLSRLCKNGYVMHYRRGSYSLSDKGQRVYSELNENLKVVFSDLVMAVSRRIYAKVNCE